MSVVSSIVLTGNSPQDVTVPAGADTVVAMWGYYSTSGSSVRLYSATLGGTAFDESVEALGSSTKTAGGAFAWYGVTPGTYSLAWSKTTPSSARGPIITVLFISSKNTAWRDSDAGNSSGSTSISKTIDSDTADLVIKVDTQINAVPSLSSGWTSITTQTYGTFYQRVSSCDSPGASSTVCVAEDENYSSLACFSLEEGGVYEVDASVEAGAKAESDANIEVSVSTSEEAGAQASSDASYGGAVAEFEAGVNAESDAAKEIESNANAGAGANVEADAYTVDCRILETVWVSAEADAMVVTSYAEAEAGALAEADFNFESFPFSSVSAGVLAEADAYNYSEWIRNNLGRAKKRFIFILTGAADSLEDATIPISSFQARKRSGDPTYLSVSIPSFNYNTEITDRPNGQMVIYAGYEVDGELSLLEELIRADMSEIAPYKGAKNRSVVLTGYRTVTFAPKSVTLDKAFYSFIGTGNVQHRFAAVDLFLNPGDTLTVDDVEIVVGSISYSVSISGELMQVFEGQ